MKNLVIVMVGDGSLHPEYAQQRDFDLWIIYYGDDAQKEAQYRSDADRFWKRKGLKIELIRRILLEEVVFRERFNFREYGFVLLPDDDVRFQEGAASVHSLFEAAGTLRADCFQPAIQNEHFSARWEPTRLIEGIECHGVNIVEIMACGFSSSFFCDAFLPAIHAMQFMRSGWGLEVIAMKIGEAAYGRRLRSYVIDAVPIIHTRPVGSGASYIHQLGLAEYRLVPQVDVNRQVILSRHEKIKDAVPNDEAVEPSAEVPIAVCNTFGSVLAAAILPLRRYAAGKWKAFRRGRAN